MKAIIKALCASIMLCLFSCNSAEKKGEVCTARRAYLSGIVQKWSNCKIEITKDSLNTRRAVMTLPPS